MSIGSITDSIAPLLLFVASAVLCTMASRSDSESAASASPTKKVKATPRPVVICGPSGVGKGTLIDLLMKRFTNDQFGFSVSHTTRGPREGEVDGVHYNFTSVENIKKDIDDGKFIEYAEVHGRYYGSSFQAVESVQESGKVCILDIDIQGVQIVKKSVLKPYYIFIAPPEPVLENLGKRLRGRGTESEEDMKKRLSQAKTELDYGLGDGNFHAVVTNDNLDEAFERMVKLFKTFYPHLKECEKKD